MTTTEAPKPAAPGTTIERLLARCAGLRWSWAAIAIALAGFWLAGVLPLPVGLAIFAVLVVVTALAQPVAERRAAAAQPAVAPWPDAAVMSLAESLPDPCFILDRRGIIRHANSKAGGAFALRTGDSLAFRLRVPDLTAAFERVTKGEGSQRVEFVERVPTERWFAAWLAPLDLPAARPGDFVVLVLDDLTERHRTDRIRVDFVANASHELRTPLASLAGFIETLQGPARDDVEARERFLAIMKEQADRMARIIDDLLSLSRIEMKAHVRPTGEVELSGIVRHVAESLEPLARDLGVTIETEISGAPLTVTGDRDELVQIFANLVENACKYGQSGERVVVSAGPAAGDGHPQVAVRDFGPGIAEEHLPRLTERFYRVDVETSRRHRGTGLGLAIVKHVLNRHRARMTVTSRLGEGATFRVDFPGTGTALAGYEEKQEKS